MHRPFFILALAFSALAVAPAHAQEAAAAKPLSLQNNMAVMSSDGVKVAEVNHVPANGRTYGPDETFFTADRYYMLRRIYGREATVSGNVVRLKLTAAQFRARHQNPD